RGTRLLEADVGCWLRRRRGARRRLPGSRRLEPLGLDQPDAVLTRSRREVAWAGHRPLARSRDLAQSPRALPFPNQTPGKGGVDDSRFAAVTDGMPRPFTAPRERSACGERSGPPLMRSIGYSAAKLERVVEGGSRVWASLSCPFRSW